MHRTVKALIPALLVCAIALGSAFADDKPQPSSDPGEQIKNGFISVGHGIRDGAIKAWGAVKSAVGGDKDGDKDASKKGK